MLNSCARNARTRRTNFAVSLRHGISRTGVKAWGHAFQSNMPRNDTPSRYYSCRRHGRPPGRWRKSDLYGRDRAVLSAWLRFDDSEARARLPAWTLSDREGPSIRSTSRRFPGCRAAKSVRLAGRCTSRRGATFRSCSWLAAKNRQRRRPFLSLRERSRTTRRTVEEWHVWLSVMPAPGAPWSERNKGQAVSSDQAEC